MDLFLVICTGIGLAVAAGIRPFLPAMLAGALASASTGLNFHGTNFLFLQDPAWLIIVVAGLAATVGYERRRPGAFDAGTLGACLAGVSIGLGALLFAAALDDLHYEWWPGLLGGIACAALANTVTRGFFARASSRLDPDSRSAMAVYKDGASLLVAALAIALPPVSLVVLGGLLWMWWLGRGRDDEKYAGLRILR
jgi:chromate transport protein ChrA